MAKPKRSETAAEWDRAVQANLKALKEASKMTYPQIARLLETVDGSTWSRSRTLDLFGAHGTREFKWWEIVALSRVFRTSIFDIVTPDEDVEALARLADAFELPPEGLSKDYRNNYRRSARERLLVKEAYEFHPDVRRIRLQILEAIWSRHPSQTPHGVPAEFEVLERVRELETQSRLMIDRLKDAEDVPNPSLSPTLRDLAAADADLDIYSRDQRHEKIDPEDADDPYRLWDTIWREAQDERDKGRK